MVTPSFKPVKNWGCIWVVPKVTAGHAWLMLSRAVKISLRGQKLRLPWELNPRSGWSANAGSRGEPANYIGNDLLKRSKILWGYYCFGLGCWRSTQNGSRHL